MDLTKLIESWKTAVTKPAEFFAQASKNASFTEGAIWFAIAFAITGLLEGVRQGLSGNWFALPSALIVTVIGGLVISIIAVGLFWILAYLFGGNGGLRNQYYATAGYEGPLFVMGMLLSIIPVLGPLLFLALNLYSIYLTWLMIKVIHNLSSGKAALVIIIPVVIVAIIAAVLMISMLAVLGAAAAGGLPKGV